jgi:hypothetical protein
LVSSFGEEKLVVPLIATPDVDNANRRQEEGKKQALKEIAPATLDKSAVR